MFITHYLCPPFFKAIENTEEYLMLLICCSSFVRILKKKKIQMQYLTLFRYNPSFVKTHKKILKYHSSNSVHARKNTAREKYYSNVCHSSHYSSDSLYFCSPAGVIKLIWQLLFLPTNKEPEL